MKHTPEPWIATKRDDVGYDVGGERSIMAIVEFDHEDARVTGDDEANAKRIVACVNACKGIKDPEQAVPMLLEACRFAFARSYARSETRQKWTSMDQYNHEKLKEAIAKADPRP